MKLLRAYANRSEAELDLALLRANRIDAVLASAEPVPPGAAAQPLHLAVPMDQHLQALALLADEAESHAQVAAVAAPATTARRIAVVLIRAAALFFVVNALLYLASIGEHLWRARAAQSAPTEPHPAAIQEDCTRAAWHALLGGLLLAYAEPLARVICRGRSNRRSGRDGPA